MNKKIRQPDFDNFQPSEYMRARRPELFSDSKIVEEPRLQREVFEYHLNTLTSRKQEYEFEYFARRLAEKELCPNLLPQTGPTGGGDSKTDTETYPVADSISLTWYEGIGREAAEERWAFAFSAKKDWSPKIHSDVDKIIKTKRSYSLIYFISNQFIKDKKRAEIEDELSNKHNIQVRILDRSWIVKCIFEHDRQDLAIEALGLTQYEKKIHSFLGPQDVQNKAELKELENNINDVNRYKGVEYQLAEDCMQAALLARNLEKPRVEVDGRFDRAERVAEKVNYRQQRMRIAYIRTWTSFFWYNDFNELNKGYDHVEKFALGSEQAEDLDKLVNLWMLLAATVKQGQLDAAHAKLDERKNALKCDLERLAAQKDRPNNAILARTRNLLIALYEALDNGEQIDRVFGEFADIIRTCKDLLGFPFEFLADIFQELVVMLPDSKKLDELFESILQLAESRTSEGTAGCMLLKRGFQRLEREKKYDAIKLFGRAQEKLMKDEYREEFVRSLVGCALAYESAGLLWAARRNMLAAANETLKEFWKHGNVEPITLYYLRKLVWLELQLGRIPCVLSWVEMLSVVANSLVLDESKKEQLVQDCKNQDVVLGLLLLKTELSDLNKLDFMPSVLEKVGLISSWMALLYALGHEEYLLAEKVISVERSSDEILDFFAEWISQPASNDLPERPELLCDTEVTFSTFVIGCHLKIKAANEFESICLGETILAVLEAFLATGIGEGIFPYNPELKISIKPSEFVTGVPQYRIEDGDGVVKIEIRHANGFLGGTVDQRKEYNEWLSELMVFVLSQTAVMDNPEITFEKMANEGAAFTRALSIVDVDVCIKNILGENSKFCLWAWRGQTNDEIFPLQRNIPWYEGIVSKEEQTDSTVHPPKLKQAGAIDILSGIDNLKHSNLRVHSVINMPLWEKAKWGAMAYATAPNKPPFFVLGFTNSDAGKAIFKGWQSRFGKSDEEEYIRVSIIRGIDETQPYSYRVMISVNPKLAMSHSQNSNSFMVCRIHQMEPSTPENLQLFLDQYEKTKSYVILPALYKNPSLAPELFPELGIEKRELHVCEAWQVDEKNPDVLALSPDMSPVIPSDIKDPPVHRAIEFLRKVKSGD